MTLTMLAEIEVWDLCCSMLLSSANSLFAFGRRISELELSRILFSTVEAKDPDGIDRVG